MACRPAHRSDIRSVAGTLRHRDPRLAELERFLIIHRIAGQSSRPPGTGRRPSRRNAPRNPLATQKQLVRLERLAPFIAVVAGGWPGLRAEGIVVARVAERPVGGAAGSVGVEADLASGRAGCPGTLAVLSPRPGADWPLGQGGAARRGVSLMPTSERDAESTVRARNSISVSAVDLPAGV